MPMRLTSNFIDRHMYFDSLGPAKYYTKAKLQICLEIVLLRTNHVKITKLKHNYNTDLF